MIINSSFILWLAAGKPSFSSNDVEEIRPGSINSQRFSSHGKFFRNIHGWDATEIWVNSANVEFGVRF